MTCSWISQSKLVSYKLWSFLVNSYLGPQAAANQRLIFCPSIEIASKSLGAVCREDTSNLHFGLNVTLKTYITMVKTSHMENLIAKEAGKCKGEDSYQWALIVSSSDIAPTVCVSSQPLHWYLTHFWITKHPRSVWHPMPYIEPHIQSLCHHSTVLMTSWRIPWSI